jgi:polyhydroxyalkanoate synthesis repressor PhaR
MAGKKSSSAAGRGTTDDGVITIKKYANRRLYDTQRSSYITLEDLAAMVREGHEFRVLDAKSEEDITRSVLAQIIMEEEQRGQTMLPVNFLRQLITLYGDSMQALVPGYLEASMDSFRTNQQKLRTAIEGALVGNPLAEIAKRNMAMLEAATSAFRPQPPRSDTASKDTEIAALRAELAELKAALRNKG